MKRAALGDCFSSWTRVSAMIVLSARLLTVYGHRAAVSWPDCRMPIYRAV